MAVVFSFCYLGHRQINYRRSSYDDRDSVSFAVSTAIFWPLTIWFLGPYMFMNLYKGKWPRQ